MRLESHMAIFRKSEISYRFYTPQKSSQGLLISRKEAVRMRSCSLAIMLSMS